MSIRSWLSGLFAQPILDMTKPDPMPYVAADGCRFSDPEVRDGNFEHASLSYSPRWIGQSAALDSTGTDPATSNEIAYTVIEVMKREQGEDVYVPLTLRYGIAYELQRKGLAFVDRETGETTEKHYQKARQLLENHRKVAVCERAAGPSQESMVNFDAAVALLANQIAANGASR